MSTDLPSWPRPHYQAGGGDAFLFFAIYGRFAADIELSAAEYRTAGVSAGLALRRLNRAQSPEFPFSSAAIGELLRPKNPALFAAAQSAAECLILQGVVADPPDLNYLRDAVGLAMYFLDHGGDAAIDPLQFKLYDAASWRRELFDPQPPVPAHHVMILSSDEDKGAKWYHTRGLRKFGRPDLSLHGVAAAEERAVIELFERFIQRQAHGGVIAEGEEVRTASLPRGLTCHHAGGLEDADFNNVHVELSWK